MSLTAITTCSMSWAEPLCPPVYRFFASCWSMVLPPWSLWPLIQETTTRAMARGSTPGSLLNLWSSVATRAWAK